MSRITPLTSENLTAQQAADYQDLVDRQHVTNMQRTLIRDHATYRAYDAWHLSWDRLVELVGLRTATVFAHAISTANKCQLCSLYFVADLRELGIDPREFSPTSAEKSLIAFAQAAVTNPNAIPDLVFNALRHSFDDDAIVAIVGFVGQMLATNTFNSILQVDLDGRLIPLRTQFSPVHE